MLIDTRSSDLDLVFATNATRTGSAVTQPADQTATPATVTTAGSESRVIDLGATGTAANGLLFFPFGTDTAAQTFLLGIFGWDFIPGDQSNVLGSWHASLLASFTCTLSTTAKGLANTRVNASQFYCDTIAVLAGNSNVSCEAVSPTSNLAACCRLDGVGSRYVDVRTWRNGSAVSANALFRKL